MPDDPLWPDTGTIRIIVDIQPDGQVQTRRCGKTYDRRIVDLSDAIYFRIQAELQQVYEMEELWKHNTEVAGPEGGG